MQVGGADKVEAARQKKNLLRKQAKGSATTDSGSGEETPGQVTEDINQNMVVDMEEDDDFTSATRRSNKQNNQNRLFLVHS